MSGKLLWYWHRLRAMSPGEMLLHARKKLRQAADAKGSSWPAIDFACAGAFPKLPQPEDAPEVLREALKRDVQDILGGRWKFFGHLELQVDAPPKWQFDYVVGRNVETSASAFKLNYRSLEEGLDSKVIWEPSRWHQLVRLAMAAYVLGDRRAGEKCVEWLEDWVKHNPPYRGWNWTSALEVGMRLIQFAWIDALLGGTVVSDFESRVSSSEPELPGGRRLSTGFLEERLERLRRAILPPHVWYAWRHQSFGSSANNHLLGELAGCIVATVRWPDLAKCGASLEELQRRWEREVLAQFAEDGGNQEQALNYHLFSWELCWQARMALAGAGRRILPELNERMRRAAQFFEDVQVPSDPWDYGDSDSGFVTPLFADARKVVAAWHEWFWQPAKEQALEYWMGTARRDLKLGISVFKVGEWRHFPVSGYAMRREGDWTLRWDLSPLGLGTMAAHGHLDALHVSLWLRGVAMVIDPGTGAYHADKQLRNWLASRCAHNSPCPSDVDFPSRLGPFLWNVQHDKPVWDDDYPDGRWAALKFPEHLLERSVIRSSDGAGWTVRDGLAGGSSHEFHVRWQFAPDSRIEGLGKRCFRVTRHSVPMEVQVSEDWAEVWCVTEQSQVAKADPDAPLAGSVSPAFRKTGWAPYLKLLAQPQGDKPCVFSTTFLVSPRL